MRKKLLPLEPLMYVWAGLILLLLWWTEDASAQDRRHFSGIAAFYSADYRGNTACGDRYDPAKFTAAHRTLPFGTRVRVTDPKSRRTVVVVVNDRGPFTKGRVLDLSMAAAKALHMIGHGLIRITAEVEGPSAFR